MWGSSEAKEDLGLTRSVDSHLSSVEKMELVGIPHRIVVGERGLKDGQLEYKGRNDAEAMMIPATDIIPFLKGRLCGA